MVHERLSLVDLKNQGREQLANLLKNIKVYYNNKCIGPLQGNGMAAISKSEKRKMKGLIFLHSAN